MRTDRVFGTHKLYTGIHNALLDAMMPKVSGNAWKVLTLIIRQTEGWKREEIGLSYRDLLKGTGIASRATIANAIEELKPFNLLIVTVQTKWEESLYRLNQEAALIWEPVDFGHVPVTETVTQDKRKPVTKTVTGKKRSPVTKTVTEPVTENELSYRNESKLKQELEGESAPARENENPGLSPLSTAICAACDRDPELLSPKHWSDLRGATIKLEAKQRTPDEVREFRRRWDASDWRGRKGEPPTFWQIVEEWQQLMGFPGGANNGNNDTGSRRSGTQPASGAGSLKPRRSL